MILAAADAGRYGTPAPPLLRQAWQLKRWDALPEAGGLRDQPAGLLQRMGHLLDIYNAHRAYAQALVSYPGEKIQTFEAQNPDVMALMAHARKLKKGVSSGD